MKKLFFSLLLAASAICIAPSQNLSAHEHRHHEPVYGSFYTTETGTDISAGDSVPFISFTAKSEGVNLSEGNIWIEHCGDYLVTYGTTISSPAEFQLFLNGTFIPGTQQTQGPGLYHPFSTIIHVECENSILGVVAVTATALQNQEAGDSTAYLTIVKVN